MIDDAVQSVQLLLLVCGCLFFAIGTLGLFRFRDTLSRTHALTKVDNLGLGFLVIALLPEAGSLALALKILLIWLVALGASATSAHLVARAVVSQRRQTTREADDA